MIELFTEKALRVIGEAQNETTIQKLKYVAPEQILIGLLADETGELANLLNKNGLSLELVKQEAEKFGGEKADTEDIIEIPFDDEARKIIELAVKISKELGHSFIGESHLLLALIKSDNANIKEIFTHFNIDTEKLQKEISFTMPVPSSKDYQINDTYIEVYTEDRKRYIISPLNITTIHKERYSVNASGLLQLAEEEANRLNCRFVCSNHLLLALMREEKSTASIALKANNATLKKARKYDDNFIPKTQLNIKDKIYYSDTVQNILNHASRISEKLNNRFIGTEHILLSLLEISKQEHTAEKNALKLLTLLKINPNRLNNTIIKIQNNPKLQQAILNPTILDRVKKILGFYRF